MLPEGLQVEQAESNSSVITAFAKIYRLGLLERLFRKVVVPEAVWREITVEGSLAVERY